MAIVPSTAAIRQHNLQLVLTALQEHRPVSRADLALRTGLSKPTIGGALRSFLEGGLVREYGRTTGRRGPSASLYELVCDSVLVLGIDIGARYVRWVLANLDGAPVDQDSLRLTHAHADDVIASVREVRARVAGHVHRVAAAVAGLPGVIDPTTGRVDAAPNIEGWEGILAKPVLTDALGLPILVENDVNLACLGEQAKGAGNGVDNFAYLNIGSGLGAGIVLHGRLHRGARGAAGEVGFLPVGADPFDPVGRAHGGAMEARLSTQGLVATAERLAEELPTSAARPFEVQTLFEAARTGDTLGRTVAAQAAREIAVCVAGITAVVDLELVLVGGGIGAGAELLLPEIRAAVAELVPAPPQIEQTALGEQAVRAGAVAVALDEARRKVVERLVEAESMAGP